MKHRFIKRWNNSNDRVGLDILLGQAPEPATPLRERLDWMERLVNWVRIVGPNAAESEAAPSRLQTARLRYMLQIKDRNPELKKKVAESLRSIIRDTRALELFMNAGIPNQQGFFTEFFERLGRLFLPQPPHDKDLVSVFSDTFRSESDSEWIRRMDPELFQGWVDLFNYSDEQVLPWNTLIQDARDALFLIAHEVRSTGLSRLVRDRVPQANFRDLPFFELTDRVDALLKAQNEDMRIRACLDLEKVVERCFANLAEIHVHFRKYGASIALVYQSERLAAQLQRLGTLAKLLAGYQNDSRFIQEFFGLLVQENTRAQSLRGLLEDNLTLISQKIIETNAETGEHYITRDSREYLTILKKSWGGGALTGFTILFKYLLYHLSLAPFIAGLFAFANYATSFIAMQLLGFTLATKQPAMTATALATEIQKARESVDGLVDEIVHLIRSQFAAVAGNLTAVVPAVILIDLIFSLWGSHLTDVEHAHYTIESFSILGVTPFYAAFTGVLLWMSSVFAGWFGNWFAFREMPEAIESHRRLRFVFGAKRMSQVADFLRRQVPGFAANLSLGFLLGMTPQLASFFGLPLDVRHVTLSSGSLTASVLAIGPIVFSSSAFWLAVGGILSMAVLNLAVSFALAMTVALWATKAPAPQRGLIYRGLVRRFLKRPWAFLVPVSVATPD